jgi:hypothetical protein
MIENLEHRYITELASGLCQCQIRINTWSAVNLPGWKKASFPFFITRHYHPVNRQIL